MTTAEDRDRRKNDRQPGQQLEWDTEKPLIAAALSHLALERAAACAIQIPDTDPPLYVAIGTPETIGKLMEIDRPDTSAHGREGEHAGRFDRVTPQPDGSFQHSYRGEPVAGPTRVAAPATGALVAMPEDALHFLAIAMVGFNGRKDAGYAEARAVLDSVLAAPHMKRIFAAPATDALVAAPIQMILHCPNCHTQHIDAPDERTASWTNPPHRSHLCHACGDIWRPADVPTEGVRAIRTKGSNDSESAAAPAEPTDEQLRDAIADGLRGLYGCGRAWSAWSVGTMSEDDFYPADESDECITQVFDAIRATHQPTVQEGGAV
jgi:hypothetical protein